MKNKTIIPIKFTKYADSMKVPAYIAHDLFTRFSHKKGVDDIVSILSKNEKMPLKDSRKAVADLRTMFKEIKRDSAIVEETDIDYLSQAFSSLQNMIGKTGKCEKKINPKKTVKAVFAGDFHIPFIDEEAIQHLMNEDADELYMMGDLLDMYGASRHRTTIDYITVRDELAQGRAIMEMFSKRFNKVYYLLGNHDDRATRKIMDLAPQLLPLIIDPMELLSKDLNNVFKLKTSVPNTSPKVAYGEDAELQYMGVVGDIVLGHFDNFIGQDASLRLAEWLKTWDHVLKIGTPSVIMQAHTHRLNMQYTSKGQLLVGTGCMCRPMPYQFENHGKYIPPTTGYIKMNIVDGYADQKSIEMVKI